MPSFFVTLVPLGRCRSPENVCVFVTLVPFGRCMIDICSCLLFARGLWQTVRAEVLKGGIDETAVEALRKDKGRLDIQRKKAERRIEECRAVQT